MGDVKLKYIIGNDFFHGLFAFSYLVPIIAVFLGKLKSMLGSRI